jgi:hypothetical protein
MAWFTNLSGVFWAWLIISASSLFDSVLMGYALTGLVTMGMCLQASYRGLAFIPGAFIGCCATFALGPDILALTSALMLGGLLGLCMSQFTVCLIRLESGFTGIIQSKQLVKTDLQAEALEKETP